MSATWHDLGRIVGAMRWNISDELSATQLVTLRQLDPRLKYEIKVSAKSSASADDVTSATQLVSFDRQPGKHIVS